MNGKNSIRGLLLFSLAIAVLVAMLKIINWVPRTIQKDALRRYASIDDVRASLNIRDIHVPAYFPQNIAWPPSEILAQGKPFPAVVMEFTSRDNGELVLILSQSRGGPSPAGPALDLTSIRETVPFLMKGRKAVLVVGACLKDEPCSKITWDEDAYTVTALMKAAPFELKKITESMIR